MTRSDTRLAPRAPIEVDLKRILLPRPRRRSREERLVVAGLGREWGRHSCLPLSMIDRKLLDGGELLLVFEEVCQQRRCRGLDPTSPRRLIKNRQFEGTVKHGSPRRGIHHGDMEARRGAIRTGSGESSEEELNHEMHGSHGSKREDMDVGPPPHVATPDCVHSISRHCVLVLNNFLSFSFPCDPCIPWFYTTSPLRASEPPW